jgi:hypothetical protein
MAGHDISADVSSSRAQAPNVKICLAGRRRNLSSIRRSGSVDASLVPFFLA